eukprot:TRINITY_DN31670_c0_g1_i1.p2 TRINITY_DN31670_c0_g1~~TRINITY_DN31670_c0_g1_i1.p2  ORF type:complete len:124 (-),score=14.14 TRINITY_DN31670_c0_g1_i1:130-501(-)
MCGMVELVTYDEFKAMFIRADWWPYQDSLPTHFAASLAAGFLSTVASAPIDLVKSRMMNQLTSESGRPLLYRTPMECIRKTLAKEGFQGLYAGFWPNYLRLGPHTVLVFVVIDQLRHGMGWAA